MPPTIVMKGDTVALKGKNAIVRAMLGLGWDVNEGQSQYDFDADATLIFRGPDGSTVDVLYYGTPGLTLGYATHSGDNRTGDGEGDDEQVHVDLSAVPPSVQYVDAVINIYQAAQRQQHFGMLESAFARLVNDDTSAELVRTNLTDANELFGAESMWLARLSRNGPTWDFTSVQRAIAGDLQFMVNETWPTV